MHDAKPLQWRSGGLWGELEGVQRRQRRSRPRGAAAAQGQDLRELEVPFACSALNEVLLTDHALGELGCMSKAMWR